MKILTHLLIITKYKNKIFELFWISHPYCILYVHMFKCPIIYIFFNYGERNVKKNKTHFEITS